MLLKRGQITLVMILILVAGLITGTYMYIQNMPDKLQLDEGIFESDNLPLEKEKIISYGKDCINRIYEPLLFEIAFRGGSFIDDSKLYHNVSYNYLCKNDDLHGCVNRMVTRQTMSDELNSLALSSIGKCLNFDVFEGEGFDVELGEIDLDMNINVFDVIVDVSYPIKIKKGNFEILLDGFTDKIDIELGLVYDLANLILNSEIESSFDESDWMSRYGGLIEIEKHKPYPDIVYSLNKYDDQKHNSLVFNFAVQGRDTITVFNKPLNENFLGYCFNPLDNNCYFNVDSASCYGNLVWSEDEPSKCEGLTDFNLFVDDGALDCGSRKHGESWCVYDGIVGVGFDAVGSRHYKQTCIDGKIYNTECRDYREELCVEDGGVAVCRDNRWRDCAQQENPQDCLDTGVRDCYWSDWLVKSKPFRTLGNDFSDRKCFPYVPPGLKHWDNSGVEVCRMANEQFDCDGTSCPQAWVDSTAVYCYFQGDCGNYFNSLKYMSVQEGANSDGEPKPYVYGVPLIKSESYSINLPLNVSKVDISGLELIYAPGMPQMMEANQRAYKARAAGFKSKIQHDIMPAGIFGPINTQIDIDVLHDAYCNVWKAPDSDTEGVCGLCADDPNKPCSEYKCRSLSSRCVYKEVGGYGLCLDGGESYSEISLNDAYFLSDDVNLFKSDFNSDHLEKVELNSDYYNDIEGFSVMGDIEPYSNMVFYVENDVPIQCKINNYNPNTLSFQSGVSASPKYPLVIKAKPPRVLQDDIYGGSLLGGMQGMDMSIFDFDSMQYQIDNALANMGDSFDNPIMGSFKNLTKSMGLSTNLSESIFEIKNMSESLDDDFDEIKDQTRDMSIQMESNVVYAYITCNDVSGNDFLTFVRYRVGDDTKKPVLIGSSLGRHKVYFNEPVECFIDDGKIDCDNNVEDKYMCSDDKVVSGARLRCVDNIPDVDEFDIKVIDSNHTGILGNEFGFSGNIFLKDGVLNIYDMSNVDSVVEINSSSIMLNITSDKDCYNSLDALSCDGSFCSKEIYPGDYHFRCVEDVGVRHEAEFVLG